MAGTLYLVPTPIGNLGDISQRMAKTLAEADFIAAEDTRVTVKLLNHLGIKKPMVPPGKHGHHGLCFLRSFRSSIPDFAAAVLCGYPNPFRAKTHRR